MEVSTDVAVRSWDQGETVIQRERGTDRGRDNRRCTCVLVCFVRVLAFSNLI